AVYPILFRLFFYFFFQAEDGIRDFHVTGVQTCALPICPGPFGRHREPAGGVAPAEDLEEDPVEDRELLRRGHTDRPEGVVGVLRSEERRVGKEGRDRWAPDD